VEVVDQHESVWYPAIDALPEARPLVFNLMAAVQGERLGRVMVTRLPAGGRIYPHTDDGAHAEYFERFHVVLSSGPGCKFRAGDETVHMAPGEVWWFDNSQEHEVMNDSKDERLHLIVDIRCQK
jgi:quercetin dioxygenase-like cupin family protein